MSDVHPSTPPGAWPWGKGKETYQEQHPPGYFDESSEAPQAAKDAAGDTKDTAEGQAPIDMKDTEKKAGETDNLTNGEVPDTGRTEPNIDDTASEAQGKLSGKKGDKADNPLEELQSGLKEGEETAQTGEGGLTELEPEALTEEEKQKLTPGKDVDVEALTGEDVPKEGEEALEEGEKLPEDAEGTLKEGEEGLEGELPEGELPEGSQIPEGEDALKEGTVAEGELPEGEEALKEGEEGLEGSQVPEVEGSQAGTLKGSQAPGTVTSKAELATVLKDLDFDRLSILKGGEVNKDGNIVNEDGKVIGRIKEGVLAKLIGKHPDENGIIWDEENGEKLGEAELIPQDERESILYKPTGSQVPPEGTHIELATALGDLDFDDLSILKNGIVNKGGNVVNEDGKVVGRVKEGVLAHLVGKRVDENGDIWNDSGKKIGTAELIPQDERPALLKGAAPFEAFPDAVVDGEGYVVFNDERIGKVIEGDIKALRGMKVDADGDILDRSGNVVGKAERWEPEPEAEPEPEPEVDNSILAGKRVNKAGNVVDSAGVIYGRVVEGDPKKMIGRMCDKNGNILSESGDIIGRAEVVPEGEREGLKEGPFAELEGCTVAKDGTVVTPSGDIVGRLIQGDGKVLYGRAVDEDGDVVDRNGNVLGKAERWEPEPEPEKKKSPLFGRRVNREGNVVDEDGNIIGRLTTGDLNICSGKEIDADGDVIDYKGNVIGHASLLEDIPPEEEVGETEEERAEREQAESDKKLAIQMAFCLTQVLDKIKPICDMITRKIDAAERKPKEELDEEELVREVRPLIEEGGKILTEANGIIRGLDPDGRIQANAKHKSGTREATPEEFHLAEVLKELTGTVTQTIENAKKKIEGMPHAKKELNPLWGLLNEPLFQILAGVGMLLAGVLGIVGKLLGGIGLGGIVDGLLGSVGIKQILASLGVGSLTDALTGKKEKKKGGFLGLGG